MSRKQSKRARFYAKRRFERSVRHIQQIPIQWLYDQSSGGASDIVAFFSEVQGQIREALGISEALLQN